MPDVEMFYRVVLTYDGRSRNYWCETHFDTVILFDALYRGAKFQTIEVYDNRTQERVQMIGA